MKPESVVQKDQLLANRLLERAEQILGDIDEAYIIRTRGHYVRRMPTFRPEEISLGRTLGTGGFGIVSEVTKFTLDPEMDQENAGQLPAICNQEHPDTKDEDAEDEREETATKAFFNSPGPSYRVSDRPEELSMNDHIHYDIRKARLFMAQRCTRRGVARFAIKRLHGHLTEVERARGMIDLAIEAKYLSVVWHPNIIKLRGIAKGNPIDRGFFIILDRLFQTLDVRIKQWASDLRRAKGFCLGFLRKKTELRELLVARMTVAYDLAHAFMYLHENRLVYRDIKPENIGFDIRGDVKVFDFGLCKSLSSKDKAPDNGYGYKLTGRAGSLPYMAPEVVRMETYDTKCDVFSFAILLWEILCLKQAFEGVTPSWFVENVVIDRERLPIPRYLPPLTRLMIPEAWDNDPRKRPDMKRVAILIRADLNDMTTADDVLHRTAHMKQRSDHSLRVDDVMISERSK